MSHPHREDGCDADCETCDSVALPAQVQSPCPNGLLPDGEICPRCGGPRAPSGVDGGSWVHFSSTPTQPKRDSEVEALVRDSLDAWITDPSTSSIKQSAPAVLAVELAVRYAIKIAFKQAQGQIEQRVADYKQLWRAKLDRRIVNAREDGYAEGIQFERQLSIREKDRLAKEMKAEGYAEGLAVGREDRRQALANEYLPGEQALFHCSWENLIKEIDWLIAHAEPTREQLRVAKIAGYQEALTEVIEHLKTLESEHPHCIIIDAEEMPSLIATLRTWKGKSNNE